jgi:hypothetical protein
MVGEAPESPLRLSKGLNHSYPRLATPQRRRAVGPSARHRSRPRPRVRIVRRAEGTESAFVPEGLNDRSQAIYCLERVQLRIRPVRARSDSYPWLINRPDRGTSIGPNHTVPYGTDRSWPYSRQ